MYVHSDQLRLTLAEDPLPIDDEVPLEVEDLDLTVAPEPAPTAVPVAPHYRPALAPAPRPPSGITSRDLAAAAVGGLVVGLVVAVGSLMRWGRA